MAQVEDEGWSDERMEAGLARLKEMHVMCRRLRYTIPNMVRPLTTQHSSPEQLFREFATASRKATHDIDVFQRYMQSPESKAVLNRAASSRRFDTSYVEPWIITSDPDWFIVAAPTEEMETSMAVQEEEMKEVEMTDVPDVSEALKSVRKTHPDMHLELDKETHSIQVRVPLAKGSQPLQYTISIGGDQSNPQFTVKCKQTTGMYSGMARHLESKREPQGLEDLLEMLEAYGDIWDKKCKVCDKLIDKSQLPAIRRLVENSKNTSNSEKEWDAIHEGCV